AGATVRAYDPEAMNETRRLYGERDDLLLCDSPEAAVEGADALVLATEWQVFRAPDFAALARRMNMAVLIDGRNIYTPQAVVYAGFTYYGIGRRAGTRPA